MIPPPTVQLLQLPPFKRVGIPPCGAADPPTENLGEAVESPISGWVVLLAVALPVWAAVLLFLVFWLMGG